MTMRRKPLGVVGGVALTLAVLLRSGAAFAVSASEAPGQAQRALGDIERESDGVKTLIANTRQTARTPEQMIADGESLIIAKDYNRAIVVLSGVTEKYPDHQTAYPDALSLLGEAYFQSRQLLSAKRAFHGIVDKSGESRMQSRLPKAYSRLIDIALKRKDWAELDALLAKMGAGGDPTLQYSRAKALLAKRSFADARSAAESVPAGHPLYHQARYLLGAIAMREIQSQLPKTELQPGDSPPPAPPTRYASVIEMFRQVTQLAPDTDAHRRVIDLSWMAIGRLFYEADQWMEAADAYNHVDRQSPDFGTSLYELAWVYVRLGDTDRATRALEVLSVADPKNPNIIDGTLLRADLMLRSGQFDKSLAIYQSVRADYDPLRERVDKFLTSTSDPAVYYDKLAQEDLDSLDDNSEIPAIAVKWAREAQDGPAAFAVLDDVHQCRDLIKSANTLVEKLRVILNAPNRVRAFPDLKAGDEKALELLNRVTIARGVIAQGLDDAEPAQVSGELATVRAQRRDLQKRIQLIPITEADFANREASATRQWNKVSQNLQQVQLEIDQLQAVVNGLRRMIADNAGQRDPQAVAGWQSQLADTERELKGYKDQVDQLRKLIEIGKVQVGYGDSRFVEDEEARNAFRDALKRELSLVAGGAAGGSAASYANGTSGVMGTADTSEQKLVGMRKDIDVEVGKRTVEVQRVVDTEAQNIISYTQRLDGLDGEARLVVGQVAMRNFGLVRDKLRGIVLHADVGTVEQAWEVREEQITRVRNLQVERVREEQLLREELREVLDDSGDPNGSSDSAPSN